MPRPRLRHALRIGAALVALLAAIPATSTQAANHMVSSSSRQSAATNVSEPGQLGPAPAVASTAAPTREIFGYAYASSLGDPNVGYPSWNFDLLSTVAFFALHIQYNGEIVHDSTLTIWNSSVVTGLVSTAHAHGVKVVVTITAPSNAVDQCDALYNRATTVTWVMNQVKLKGIDGVNIDYEGQRRTCQSTQFGDQLNQTMLTDLAHQFRDALDAYKPGLYLSIATYSGSAEGPDGYFNIPSLAPYVNSFFIMAYDQDYYGWQTAGCTRYCMNPVSPLSTYVYNDTKAVQEYVSVVGAGKVILGLPYYGRVACVAGPTPTAHAYPTRPETAATYLGAKAVATSPDVKPGTFAIHRDATDPAGLERWDTWYDLSLGCWREMYWDDTTSLGTRYNLVNRTGIRGVGFWTLQYGGGSPELWDLLSAYFKVWSSGYDLADAPRSWVASRPQTFDVTLTNSGTYTWPSGGTNPVKLNLHFTTRPGGTRYQSYWLNSYNLSIPSDVPPGQSITMPVTITAPATTGAMYLEAEMFKNQQFWFSQTQAVPVSVAAQTWIAGYDLSGVPNEWHIGQSRTFSVTLTNNGNVPWPAGGTHPVKLNLHFTPVTGGTAKQSSWLTSQSYGLPNDVDPGASVTLTVTATAPSSTSGYLYLEAQAFRDHQFWFAQWKAASVTVYGQWAAAYDMTQVPTSWSEGQSQTFPVTLTNEGTQAWPATGTNPVKLNLHFTTVLGGSAKQSSWLTSQSFALPTNVAAGATITVSVTVTAPNRNGSIYLEAQVFKDHAFWFQQWASVPVSVAPAFAASYDTCQLPTTWAPGQTRSVTLTLTNTGSDTWPSTGTNPVKLDLHFTTIPGGTAKQSSWLTSQIYALPSDVLPGATIAMTVNATAPASAGQIYLEAQVFKDHQFWFSQWWSSPATVASAPAWAADYDVCAAPRTWTHRQGQTFQVTLTNAGSETWTSGGSNPVRLNLHFTTVPGGTAKQASWLNSYNLNLPSDVAPGQSVTVTVTIAAPSTTGNMFLEAQVFKDHQFWLQQWQGVGVTVA